MFSDIKNESVVFELIIVAIVVHMEYGYVTKACIEQYEWMWSSNN